MLLIMQVDGASYYYADLWGKRAQILASFTSLESIRVGQKQRANDPRTNIILEELGRMKSLSSWKSICSTLKRVEIFGEVLE